MTACAECGESPEPGRTCRDYFHDILALEAEVPGGVGLEAHFFAVASYNLQHPSTFVPGVLSGLRDTLADVLAGRENIAGARRRASEATDGNRQVLMRGAPAGSGATPDGWPTRWNITVRHVRDAPSAEFARRAREWASSVCSSLAGA